MLRVNLLPKPIVDPIGPLKPERTDTMAHDRIQGRTGLSVAEQYRTVRLIFVQTPL